MKFKKSFNHYLGEEGFKTIARDTTNVNIVENFNVETIEDTQEER